jgi:hypothetical protein
VRSGPRAAFAVTAVPIEMDHVVGFAFGFGLTQLSRQLLEGGRAQQIQSDGFRVGATQAFEQPAGHGAERDIVTPLRPAYHEQNSDGA